MVGQQEVDHKTNEINFFRPLLADLDIEGCLVTADSLHTQRKHAHFLVEEKRADYLFYADLNQPKLHEAVSGLPEQDWSEPYTETGKGHGRVETRTIWTSSTITEKISFPHVAQLVRIMREVDDARTRTALRTETVYAAREQPGERADPAAREQGPVADRERPALGTRRDDARRRLQGALGLGSAGARHAAQPRYRRAAPCRGDQHRQGPAPALASTGARAHLARPVAGRLLPMHKRALPG